MLYSIESIPPALIIIRGISGSGKTTLAKQLAAIIPNSVHLEADMYEGLYEGGYQRGLQKVAHTWCQNRTWEELNRAQTVIVANTFTQNWEMAPYFTLAKRCNYDVYSEVVVIECKGEFENVHNVPAEAVQKMKDRWEALDYDEVLGLK